MNLFANVLSPTAQRWTVAVIASALCAAPVRADERAEALAEINRSRQSIGLSAVTTNALLQTAAQAHADYQQTHVNGLSHDETPGLAGFTGATPSARINAAGYAFSVNNEVIDGGATAGAEAVRNLIRAIYHRFGVFASTVAEVGIGMASASGKMPVTTLNFAATAANRATPPTDWLGIYPTDRQTGVERDFLSDTETPDPVAGIDRVAYPVSLQVNENETLTVGRFSLAPEGGAALEVQLLSAATDAHTPKYAASIIAKAPLAYGTRYTVVFEGSRNGAAFNKSWQFETAPYSTMTVDSAYRRVGIAQTVRITVSGGNGGNRLDTFAWQGAKPTVVSQGAGLYDVKADAASEATITFTDNDGQTLSAKVSFAVAIAETTTLSAGWNLKGNPLATPLVATQRFGRIDAPLVGLTENIVSVWKWLAATSQWAFYAPSMTANELKNYATGKGYAVLESIEPGEGYWINAKTALSFAARSGIPATTTPHNPGSGWTLFGVGGEAMSPLALDEALANGKLSGQSLCLPKECWRVTSGALPTTTPFKTLWTWDNSGNGSWRFYAPDLARQGGAVLSNYATSKGYIAYDLGQEMHLSTGEGFWMNR